MPERTRIPKPAPARTAASSAGAKSAPSHEAGPSAGTTAPRFAHTFGALVVQRAAKETPAPSGEPLSARADVELAPQAGEGGGWAAALAMVAGAKDGQEYEPAAIAARAGMDLAGDYDWSAIQRAIGAWGLRESPARELTPGRLAELLETSGPLWLARTDDPARALVIAEVRGDAAGVELTIYNPLPPESGAVETKSFDDLVAEFELDEESGGATLVHA